MIEGWQGWREGGNPAVTHSSRRGGAPTTHKKINKQTNRELHAVEAQTKGRSRVMMLNHGCARLVTEGGLCRKLECTG